MGNTFAIPTKDEYLNTLSTERIDLYVAGFLRYAHKNPQLRFQVTRIGCGLARLLDTQVAPMFREAPQNCYFDDKWKPYLGDRKEWFNYWGTF